MTLKLLWPLKSEKSNQINKLKEYINSLEDIIEEQQDTIEKLNDTTASLSIKASKIEKQLNTYTAEANRLNSIIMQMFNLASKSKKLMIRLR